MEREDSSCCGAVEEGGRGRAALGEIRAKYALADNAREFTQNWPLKN